MGHRHRSAPDQPPGRAHPEQKIIVLSDCQCLCTTMYRIDLPHLCWVLENLLEGRVVNQIKVDEQRRGNGRWWRWIGCWSQCCGRPRVASKVCLWYSVPRRVALAATDCHPLFRCEMGEIDIIARDGKILVFVEVKTRAYDDPTPEEQVNLAKQQAITRVAKMYLSRYGIPQPPARFDIVAIVWPTGQNPIIRHEEGAFDAAS
jgi:putative endonuclease